MKIQFKKRLNTSVVSMSFGGPSVGNRLTTILSELGIVVRTCKDVIQDWQQIALPILMLLMMQQIGDEECTKLGMAAAFAGYVMATIRANQATNIQTIFGGGGSR